MKKIICCILLVLLILPCIKVCAVSTSAKAAILINGDTGEIIYSQNEDEQLPMASTTKIMTALLLCENGNLDKEITVTDQMVRVEGSSMGLLAGDKVTLRDLLYGMMLASGNDAANVTAYILGGTIDGFVKMMNQKAKQLGLLNTHFETPSGLDGEEHYTTAKDLANLARHALLNEEFAKAAASETATLTYGNPPYKRTLTNHNKLLKTFEGAVGVKTGFTKKSGRCLVSAAKRDGKFVIAVTLKDPNDWADHTELLNYGLSKVQLTQVSPPKNRYSIEVVGSDNQNIKVEIPTVSFSSLEKDGITCTVHLPEFVYAPVKKGEVIGSVVYERKGEEILKNNLTADVNVAEKPVEKRFSDIYKEKLRYIFFSIWEK